MQKQKNYTVRICTDYVQSEQVKVDAIIDRVSQIVSNSYIRKK